MLKDVLKANNAVKTGNFELTYGRKTNFFVNVKEVSTNPEILGQIAEDLSRNVRAGTIAGVELGAVPLLVATSINLGIPFVIVRKKYEHGTREPFIGTVTEGQNIDMIEDVVSSGLSIANAAEVLRQSGAEISRAICVVDREEGGSELLASKGIELIPLVRRSEIVEGGLT